MGILLVISFAIVFFTYFFCKKKIYHPVILFNGVWLIIFALYELKLIKFIEISEKTFFILLFMIIFFPLGSIVGGKIAEKMSLQKKDSDDIKKTVSLRKTIFWFICIVTIAKMLYDEFDIIINVLNGVSFKSIMAEAAGKSTIEIKGLSVVLYLFFVYPCLYFISPICANIVFTKEEKNKLLYFLVNIFVIALSVMHHGGRNAIFLFLISYGITFLMKKKKTYFSRKTKLSVILFLIVALILISNISDSRGINDLWKSFYAYFTCSIPLTELYTSFPIIQNAFLGGVLSFNGFLYPIFAILNYFGMELPQSQVLALNIKTIIEDNYLSIGDYSLNMNAFLPAGTYLYIDGGYVFEIIIMFIYGMFSGYIYQKARLQANTKTNVIYVFLTVGFILSFTRFCFTSVHYALGLSYLLFLFKNNKYSRRKNE